MPGFENGNRTARNKPEQGVAPLRAASGARVNADVLLRNTMKNEWRYRDDNR